MRATLSMPETFLDAINRSLNGGKPVNLAVSPNIDLQCYHEDKYYVQIQKDYSFIYFIENNNKFHLANECARWFTNYLKGIEK